MALRVTSGRAKGRRLKDVPGDTTRPVTDMVKQALFNIIGQDVIATTWWDLFAGTGAIGIEALSRGANFVRFSDLARPAVETIKFNLELVGLNNQSEVLHGDAFSMLGSYPTCQFDYIYIAPPQYKEMWIKSLSTVDKNPSWMGQDAWVIVQIHPREVVELALNNLTLIDERKYGSTLLLFYERNSLRNFPSP